MPNDMMRKDGESDDEFKNRVKKWLQGTTDHEFTQLAKLIDNQNDSEQQFYLLYVAEQKKRAGIKSGDNKGGPCGCCAIF